GEQVRVERVGRDRHRVLDLHKRVLQPAVADIERRKPYQQLRVVGIVTDGLLVFLERLLAIALVGGDLSLQERTHRVRVGRNRYRLEAAKRKCVRRGRDRRLRASVVERGATGEQDRKRGKRCKHASHGHSHSGKGAANGIRPTNTANTALLDRQRGHAPALILKPSLKP